MDNFAEPHSLFQVYGIEMEYMIVDRETLNVLPISDKVLHHVAGCYDAEVEVGRLAWSNELVLHVLELKTNGPARSLEPLPSIFAMDIVRINEILRAFNGCLMPTAMHPWMNPDKEMRLWPYADSRVYQTFDRIFDCHGHGWSNLQSVHINLPFANDVEFAKLHAAVRLLLPILPALAASSPLLDGKLTGCMDNRLQVYRHNADRIPSVTGQVIPEPLYSRREYETGLLDKIYADIKPHDPEGLLQEEWVNARGAIARFDRNAIEIRVLDIQESPRMDLAIAALIIAVLQALVAQRWSATSSQQSWNVQALLDIYEPIVCAADQAQIMDPVYLSMFGFPGAACTAGELWEYFAATVFSSNSEQEAIWQKDLKIIFNQGPLARRITRALGTQHPVREKISAVYGRLCDCLAANDAFIV